MKSHRLLACLRELGLRPTVRTFSDRKKLQKLVYLVQAVGTDLNFSYSWYLHGPYSPELTQVLYETVAQPLHGPSASLGTEDAQRVRKLRALLGKDIDSTDFLELLVSLHYVKKLGESAGLSRDKINQLLRQKKPFFTEQEINRCWRMLELLEKAKKQPSVALP
jgi:hypothetical protein